jgi:hypothetical protein
MSEILFQFQKVEPTTWAYLSSLLIIGLYFKFNRFWSVRNLDLCLIILLAPGLLMVYYGEQLAFHPVTATRDASPPSSDAIPGETVTTELGDDVGPDQPPTTSENPAPQAEPPKPVPDSEPDAADLKPGTKQPALKSLESPANPPESGLPPPPSRTAVRNSTGASELWVAYLPGTAHVAGKSLGSKQQRAVALKKHVEEIAFQDSEPAAREAANASDSSPLDSEPDGPVAEINPNLQPRDASERASLPKLTPEKARSVKHFGYLWLLGVSLLLMVRLLCDPTMVRRPLLEPNLSNGGLLFIGCALLIFMVANVLTSDVSGDDLSGVQGGSAVVHRHDTSTDSQKIEDYRRFGPGYYLLNILPSIPTLPFDQLSSDDPRVAFAPAARTMAIICHLSVVIAILVVGLWHFDNIKLGIGAATLYLMLPYTAQMTGHVDHVLPSALLLWAIVFYRRPALAGIFIGMAMGVVYYPLFLLPLWISFYWQRGVLRFLLGLIGAVAIMAISLAFVSEDMVSYWSKIRQMFGLFLPNTNAGQLRGIWEQSFGWDPIFRLPCIAASICLSASFAFWPAQKNLGTLLSCSAAMMLAVQFWHGYGGGTYITWFMPLVLLTIFRPNLEDRIALSVLGEGWLSRRRTRPSSPLVGRAAFLAGTPASLRPNS